MPWQDEEKLHLSLGEGLSLNVWENPPVIAGGELVDPEFVGKTIGKWRF